MPDPTVEQFQGCLIGCAVGDAVGAPVEGQGPHVIAEYVEKHVRPKLFEGVKVHGKYEFGQYTDDTQLTRELALSLVEHGKLDPDDFGQRVAHMFKNKLMVGYGSATQQAAKRLMAKCAWDKAGTPPPAAGNGSAMRGSPIGLAFHGVSLSALATAATTQGFVTHQSEVASAGCAAIAAAVALAMQVDEVKPDKFLNTVASVVGKVDSATAKLIRVLGSNVSAGGPQILEWCRSFQVDNDRWAGISPYVTSSVLWSLYSFVQHPDDYWECMITAITPGGDVDTTAAMAGAISGARVGLDGIPNDVALRVNDKGEQGHEFLVELGSNLYRKFR